MGRGGHFHIEAVHQTLQANVPFGWSRALGVLGSAFGESLGTFFGTIYPTLHRWRLLNTSHKYAMTVSSDRPVPPSVAEEEGSSRLPSDIRFKSVSAGVKSSFF